LWKDGIDYEVEKEPRLGSGKLFLRGAVSSERAVKVEMSFVALTPMETNGKQHMDLGAYVILTL